MRILHNLKYLMAGLTAIFFISVAYEAAAFTELNEFPKLANYYLQPNISESDYDVLARYDLLILDVDTQTINPSMFIYMERINPDIQFLAYIPSQSVNTEDLSGWARWRRLTNDEVNNNNWWLRDSRGNKIAFSSTWPTIKFVDPGSGWSDYLSSLAAREAVLRGVWDGVFYDMVFANLSWLNNGDIDVDRSGGPDSSENVNSYWQRSMAELIDKTSEKTGGYPVVANVDKVDFYQENLNGAMFENFPASWLGERGWEILIDEYINSMPENNKKPNITIINATNDNNAGKNNYQKMRYGLTSTLLGDGYFSFDSGDQNHAQTWWYDEYNVRLGSAASNAVNLLERNNPIVKNGLWRRDFEKGVAVVNSSNQNQVYSFRKEEFEKISGVQDRRVNNGIKTNYVSLAPQDGIILLKINHEIFNISVTNGSFVRVFDRYGTQEQNGFFAYKEVYPPASEVLLSDIDNDRSNETLLGTKGRIEIYKQGRKIKTFYPYGREYRGQVSFAVADLNGDATKEIITGAGIGGGPHVRIFNKDGEALIGGFFAYESDFRGGVNVAVMDLNGDGSKEIITGAGPGGGPHVRVFTKDGDPLTGGFFAYAPGMSGGISISTGDVNGDGEKEIITGAGPGSEPEVKVFTRDGALVSRFLAYSKDNISGIKIIANDIDSDGVDDILVSTVEY